MVAHVVLFTPKPTLTPAERAAFVLALETALRDVPGIVRASVGRRFLAGRPYDALAGTAYEYVAVLEFQSRDALVRYLDHPAHDDLARQFYSKAQAALALDFDIVDGTDTRKLVS